MSRRVIVIGPTTPLAAAWDIMVTCRIRHLPVVRDGLLLGIVSDRDALLHSTATDDDIVPPSIPVSEIMSPFPYVCDPSTHVSDIVRTMTEQKIDAMPVLDAEEKLIGLVTSTDLLLLLIQYDEARPLPFEWELEPHPSSSMG